MANILQFKDRKKAENCKAQHLQQRYTVDTETDDTIIMSRAWIPGPLGYITAVIFFPIGLVALLRNKVSIVIDAPPEVAARESDNYEALARLFDLKKQGILTEAEYNARKAKLLA
jgi:hypothetical protein